MVLAIRCCVQFMSSGKHGRGADVGSGFWWCAALQLPAEWIQWQPL